MDATGSNTVLGTTYHWSNNIGAVITDTAAYPSTDATSSGPAIFSLTVSGFPVCEIEIDFTFISSIILCLRVPGY